ncbi:hypothetical protein [Burkholderia sp. BE17]|uniref:hypothetical protein n=1 Tax=Burkholderia sp. BE17 TaxID=2656644 RepID=UPI00128ADF1D|nr:hypothetical protein [Burkholderia sp. BE17]MPV66559.1 hypothetical protein [Burkholderia sp. BE17]
MREMRDDEVTRFAKSFAHRASGRHRMASARNCRVSLTVGGSAARDGERRTGNACSARMIAWIAGPALSPARARRKGFESTAGIRATHPTTSAHTGLR